MTLFGIGIGIGAGTGTGTGTGTDIFRWWARTPPLRSKRAGGAEARRAQP